MATSPPSSVDSATKTIMAPRLAPSQFVMIRDMVSSKSLTTSRMAETAGCSKRSIVTISANLRMFGVVGAPLIPGGRPCAILPVMIEALCDHLLEKPDLQYTWLKYLSVRGSSFISTANRRYYSSSMATPACRKWSLAVSSSASTLSIHHSRKEPNPLSGSSS